jgi:G2/mitotic-specific cyclin-B, other
MSLVRSARLTEADVTACAKALAALHSGAASASLTAVYKKFSSEKFGGVAKLPSPESLLG